MSQYAAERRESVMRRLLKPEGISIRELAQETGVSAWTLYNWRKQAIEKGETVTAGGSKHRGPGAAGAKRSAAQKLAIVAESAAFNEAEFAEYCRKKGLYVEQVRTWRAQAEQAMAGGMVPAKEHREALRVEKQRNKALERELRRKEKALAETAALLTLRKKAAAIWGEGGDE
jgi:transposase-like protein